MGSIFNAQILGVEFLILLLVISFTVFPGLSTLRVVFLMVEKLFAGLDPKITSQFLGEYLEYGVNFRAQIFGVEFLIYYL